MYLSKSKKFEVEIIIPAYNEGENLATLIPNLVETFEAANVFPFRVIVVDDGSTDDSRGHLECIKSQHKSVLVVKMRRRMGKPAAIHAAMTLVLAPLVVIMDGDNQYRSEDALAVYRKLKDGYQVVNTRRSKRQDAFTVILTSWLYTKLLGFFTGKQITDHFSGLKGYNQDSIKHLGVYGNLYRFMPFYAIRSGLTVTEIDIVHQQRARGKSFFNMRKRLLLGLTDIFTLFFTQLFGFNLASFILLLTLLAGSVILPLKLLFAEIAPITVVLADLILIILVFTSIPFVFVLRHRTISERIILEIEHISSD